MEERIEIGSLKKPKLAEPANQVVALSSTVKKSGSLNFIPKLVVVFSILLLLSLGFWAGRQFLGSRLTPSAATNIDQEKEKIVPQAGINSFKETVVPEIYLTAGDDQEPCSLEFTVSGASVCLIVKTIDQNGQEITDFSQLKIGDQIRLLVNGSYREQISKARFQVNQAADSSWCQGANLSLINDWCETTNEEGDYYYVDYSFSQTGEFSIGGMIFDSNSQTWY